MKTIHVVAALIRKGNRIFATQRGYGDFRGGWEFPGGKITEGESPREALIREIREELNTEISVGKLYDTIEYDYPEFHLSMECYFASVIRGELELKEHMDSRWLSREELDQVNWLPADQQLIDRLKKEGFAIKNLIFDVGRVLLQYRWKDMFMSYGLNEEDSLTVGNLMFKHPIWVGKFDRGIWGPERMVEEYHKICPEHAPYIEQFMINAREMRGEDRTEIWEAIRKLKDQGYRNYILSNYSKYLFDLHTEDVPFLDYMDGMVVSYEPKCVKPEEEIYFYLRDKYALHLEECIFFDDRLENVEKGMELGMDGVHVTSREMLADLLESLLK